MDYDGLSDFEDREPSKEEVRPKVERDVSLGAHLQTSTEWHELKLSKPLLRVLKELGYQNPTPIQRDAIPHALAGRDVLGRAETGSGKTCAFLLPTLERLLQSNHVRRRRLTPSGEVKMGAGSAVTKVLILLPTRELAAQCHKTCLALKKYTPISCCLVTGGLSQKQQENEMRLNPDIVIATPGRCLDLLLNSASIHMDLLDIVIFDEADRLLEMGFKTECLAVLSHCSRTRQTLLFSATLNAQASEFSALALKDPVCIPKDSVDTSKASSIARSLNQKFIAINGEEERLAAVLVLLEQETADLSTNKKIVVFFNTKKLVHRFSLILTLSSLRLPPHCELHGNLTQEQRMEALNRFESNMASLLLCTDIAARGLDLDNVDLVINAEVPQEATKYIHRIGRSGRRGTSGESLTLFHQTNERQKLKEIVKMVSGKKIEFIADKIESKLINQYKKVIEEATPRVKEMIALESAERSLRLAETKAKRDQNKTIHAAEISSRPPKRWTVQPKDFKPNKKRKAGRNSEQTNTS